MGHLNMELTEGVWEYLLMIPKGKVATYGQIAEYLGNKGLARVVGNILHNNPAPDQFPCYKVINAKGELSGRFAFGGPNVQKELLEADGVEVSDDYEVDLGKYLWDGPSVTYNGIAHSEKSRRGDLQSLVTIVLIFALTLTTISPSWAASKSGWIKKKGKVVSYRLSNGKLAKGPRKIGKKIYLFNSKGRLMRHKKERRVKYGGEYYDVRKNGTIRRGWQIFDGKLYFFGGTKGEMTRNQTVDKIRLNKNGSAKMGLNAQVRYESIKLLKKVTRRDKGKMGQLRDVWRYYRSTKHFRYVSMKPNMKDKTWSKKAARHMLRKRYGSCYQYACSFAAVADAIGFKRVELIYGVLTNGQGPHTIVRINGRYYDPEAWNQFGRSNIFARRSSIPSLPRFRVIPYSNDKVNARERVLNNDGSYNYSKVKVVKADKLSLKKGAIKYRKNGKWHSAKNTVIVCKGKRYFFKGSGKGKKGTFFFKGNIYVFGKSNKYGYYMTDKSFKNIKILSKVNKPFSKLTKVIGPGEAGNAVESCFAPDGKDKTYKYKHFSVSVFVPNDGSPEIIEGVYAND